MEECDEEVNPVSYYTVNETHNSKPTEVLLILDDTYINEEKTCVVRYWITVI